MIEVRSLVMKKSLVALTGPIVIETVNVIWPLLSLQSGSQLVDSRAWISLFISGLIAAWAGWICIRKLNRSMFAASFMGVAVWVWSLVCTLVIDIGLRVSASAVPAFDNATSLLLTGGLLLIPAAFMLASFGAFLGTKFGHRLV
jgi:hypothetical protein